MIGAAFLAPAKIPANEGNDIPPAPAANPVAAAPLSIPAKVGVKEAPNAVPPSIPAKVGGTLTIEEFRNNETSDKMLTQNKVDQSYQHQPEFVKRVSMPQSTKLSDISCSSGTNEPLRLKRSKPLKRDENNLEKSLGITRKKTTP